jgi:hypothetical protein
MTYVSTAGSIGIRSVHPGPDLHEPIVDAIVLEHTRELGGSMNLKSLQRKAQQLIDRRGGTDSLKADADELRNIAKGPGSVADKAKRAGDALKDPGAKGPDTPATPRPPATDTPAPTAQPAAPPAPEADAPGTPKPGA